MKTKKTVDSDLPRDPTADYRRSRERAIRPFLVPDDEEDLPFFWEEIPDPEDSSLPTR